MKKFIMKNYIFAMSAAAVMACLSACSKEEQKVLAQKEQPSSVIQEEIQEEIQEKISEETTEEISEEAEEKNGMVNETEELDVITLEEFQAYVEELAKKVEEQDAASRNESQISGFDRRKAEEAFTKVNEQRAANGVSELTWDENLYELACTRAKEIATSFSHQRPDGTYVGEVIIGQYGAYGCGENIASNYRSVTNLINGWLNSQEHKENMLDSRFTSGTIGCYSYNGTYYWVNLFRQ